MNIGFYYGSFDPFTKGHLYVASESAKRFDKVVVTLSVSLLKIHKKRRFNKKVMEEAMKKVFIREDLKNVVVTTGFISTIWNLKKYQPTFIRGIRNENDVSYEKHLARLWKRLLGFETIFIKGGNISSTMVMEKLRRGENVEDFLSKEVLEVVKPK